MSPLNAAYNDPNAVAEDDSSYEGTGTFDGSKSDRLAKFAAATGDISDQLDAGELATLGHRVVEDWQTDKGSIQAWRDMAENALKLAKQDPSADKTFPWAGASNIQYPLLTVASQQFAARAYPAIVKGDEAVGMKVIGFPPQQPDMQPPPQEAGPEATQQFQSAVIIPFQQAQKAWQDKQGRSRRVKTWMNYHIFYGMDDWEGGVDTLLNQLPIIGSAFKKVYFDPHRGVCSDYVNALHLTVHKDTESLERCPRVTQDFLLYPYEIRSRMATGVYRQADTVLVGGDEDDQKPLVILEQHRLEDLDGDGIEEPYILTVDVESCAVLRIEAMYGDDDIGRAREGPSAGEVVKIRRWMPFIHFLFMPDPEGGFYGLGFGQLLAPLTAVINTAINQLMDAGTAQAAGGGFVGSGLRLQGAGQSPSLKFMPGEYKFVNMPGADVRAAIWERTIPQPSPVLFQLLDLVLGAAKDVASIKEVLSGDTPATAPVGTTLALIEQGLQSFSAIYKRVYRSEKCEFKAIYECQGRWGSQEEYAQVLDDPEADLKADFSPRGDDIVPVSDPSVVTRSQALAKVQVIMQVAQAFPGVVNGPEAAKRAFEGAQIDEPESLIVQAPKQPPPQLVAEIDKTKSETALNLAKADQAKAGGLKDVAEARVKTGAAHAEGAMSAAFSLGSTHAGGIPGLEEPPSQPMGGQGDVGPLATPEGGLAPSELGGGGGEPAPADGMPGQG